MKFLCIRDCYVFHRLHHAGCVYEFDQEPSKHFEAIDAPTPAPVVDPNPDPGAQQSGPDTNETAPTPRPTETEPITPENPEDGSGAAQTPDGPDTTADGTAPAKKKPAK